MTLAQLRADLIAKALTAFGQLTGVDPVDLKAMGGDTILERFVHEWERAPCDADTAEIVVYPPGDWDDITEPT